MCGIGGIVLTGQGTHNLHNAAERMRGKLWHRGPDDQGTFVSNDRRCALVHTRLSIQDLSPAGHQPMPTPDGRYWITFNGEIYNFKELRRELERAGESFASHSDTEVILKLYVRFGADCLEHLRGMFAFAVWDAEERKLFIARDRLGIKPLYFYAEDGKLIFASEVRAILAAEMTPRRIDPTALNEYLAYQSVPAPRTLIEGVRALTPGAYLTMDAAGTIEESEYWNLMRNHSAEARFADKPTTVRRVGELLREATELHLVSDVSVGVFLSGGIDSSAVTALIRELGHTPYTFSVIFAEANFDESAYARQIAKHFRAEHTEINLTERAMLDQLPAALAATDQPSCDGMNVYVVSQAVRRAGVKVALSGCGGDEFFIGYSLFGQLEKALKYGRHGASLPTSARGVLARAVELAGGNSIQASKAAAMIGSDGTLAEMYPILRQVFSLSKRRSLLSERWRQLNEQWQDPYVALLQTAYRQADDLELLSRISYAEGRTYLHDVLLRDSDQMSMAHALEVRVPLLDHKLVEYLMGVPDEFKRPNGVPKSLLVAGLGNQLPRDVVQRPKQGFTLPFADWMRHALRGFCETRLNPQRISDRGLFDPQEVHKLWNLFLKGSTEVSWSRLWVLVALEEWLETNGVQC
ncbi:MAG TPA: asparagine synthase (glutamine-hydrolyzing) [Blastocatellia bacterium]|nr:asparagine synthase (glutamine-hydrolyzing) [Blastocatellia bacterium]HMX29319.1 asparagine synthase (glutamine-hydrolyzing) [Blastocatellia bacterium]HMY70954.1 asparagine synthase (glutamine-hydrolyzing) [Blastocatellia bacterium]HMZ16400.1 asparagine synthase (glutamine-hydrolyzing) [Blastocatellia bacterium]